MQMFYDLLGRLLFPRRQNWDQRRSAKVMLLTVVFSLAFGLVVAAVIRIGYSHFN